MTENSTEVVIKDSKLVTLEHSRRVDELLLQIVGSILARVGQHDLSKMEEPEKTIFDEYSWKLKDSTYGSEEYWTFLTEMQVALRHHYANNRHHPEHYAEGVSGMGLVDVIEMLCDWKAAGERHQNGSMRDSLTVQEERFDLSPQLLSILTNTAAEAGWLD